MAKGNNRGLWIGISVLAVAGASYFIYKKFFKSKDQKECEKQGGTWNKETKSCDLPDNSTPDNSKPANESIKTGKANIDTIIERLAAGGKKGKVSKSQDGKYYIELVEPTVPVGKGNKVQFYDNDMFAIFDKDSKMISKGLYADGGRKLSVTEGKNKNVNAVTNSLYDTIKKVIG